MRGKVPAPIDRSAPLLVLSENLGVALAEFVSLYNEYVESRKNTAGQTRISEMQEVMLQLRNSYTSMLEKKEEVHTLWVSLKKAMSQAKQSRLL